MTANILRNPIYLAMIAIGSLILLSMSVNVVPETQQAIISSYGKVDRVVNPYRPGEQFGQTRAGLTFRIPFVEQIQMIDKRVLSVEMEQQEVLSTDQLRLQVDAFARFRVIRPAQMYRTIRTEDRLRDQLRTILGSSLRNELGKRTFSTLLSAERGEVMENIQTALNREASKYGAEGQKEAQIIRADAEAEAARIYAISYGKDPDFYDFYRAMQSYRQTFQNGEGSSNIILSPQNAYLEKFRTGR